ncbi:hypothetical protein OUZ56_021093 [Daphnia magna]|uniref:Uncharacterized protein n=1 Tax=Daphnia magna TaxID=35525 RepID=A0ABQ9ZGD7_9CRUS|nr:hypothetical protein OUZ56_021093 [Daphnia magna]
MAANVPPMSKTGMHAELQTDTQTSRPTLLTDVDETHWSPSAIARRMASQQCPLEIFEESIRSFVLKKVPNHKVETQNQLHPLVRVWGSGSLFVIDSRSSPRSERIAEDADDLPAKKETFSNKQRKGRKHFEDNANKMLASLFGILSTKPNQKIN